MVQPAVIAWTQANQWFFWLPVVGSFASLFTLCVSPVLVSPTVALLTPCLPSLPEACGRPTRALTCPARPRCALPRPLPQCLTTLATPLRRYPLNLVVLAVFTLFEGITVGTVVSFYESRIVIQGALFLPPPPLPSPAFPPAPAPLSR